MGHTRSFGDVCPMSGLPESGQCWPRHHLPTLLWRWPAAIAGAPPLHSVRLAGVLYVRGVSLACLLSDSQVNGSHGLPIEFGDRVTDIRLVDCDGDVTCDREDGDTLDSSDAGAVRRL